VTYTVTKPKTKLNLATRLGLTEVSANQWRGDCPACGYGSNAFALSINRDGTYHGWCAACNDQDGIVRALAGEAVVAAPKKADPAKAEKNQQRALAYWRFASPVRGTPAERYLELRGIPWLVDSIVLRFHPMVSHPDVRGRFPAMLAAVTDVKDHFLAVHRIYLAPDGRKAGLPTAKASLGPLHGGMIRLQPHDPGKPLVVGEGIENAASLSKMIGAPAWSAISTSGLKKAGALPETVRHIIVAADPGEPGEEAARWPAWRWYQEGKHVEIKRPAPGKGDFNELLLGRAR
jgi:phage/plasmid primase-like uncharacterized protein